MEVLMMSEFIKNKLLKIFLVFLAIILGFLLTTSIRLILDKKEDVPKEQKEPEKNYYIYCYINSNIDNLIEPENGFYLEYKKILLKECLLSGIGYGNIYTKIGYQANLEIEYITPQLKISHVSSVSIEKKF